MLFFCLGCSNPAEKPDTTRPNVVLIISDDQGWTDYGFMDHPSIETPHIDRLANQGQTYTRGYVTAPLCSPSLASMITGLYPHQHRITGNDPSFSTNHQRYGPAWLVQRKEHFDTLIREFSDRDLLTRMLSDHGYLTFQSGKWWLGSYEDGEFDYGMTHGDPGRGGRHGDEGLKIGRQGLDTLYRFIDMAVKAEKPFFVWYAPFLPHAPHDPPDSLLAKYFNRTDSEPVARYWANCEWFDLTVGQLTGYLEKRNLLKNSLILYICDNGWVQDPEQTNRYVEGSKRAPFDLGIRTPVILSWQGKTENVLDTETLVSSIDILPTILDVSKISIPEILPGISLMEREKLKRRNRIFSEVFFHDITSIRNPVSGLKYRICISGKWKLILPDKNNVPGSRIQLFDILEDPFEKENLAGKYPEVTGRLKNEIDTWWDPLMSITDSIQ